MPRWLSRHQIFTDRTRHRPLLVIRNTHRARAHIGGQQWREKGSSERRINYNTRTCVLHTDAEAISASLGRSIRELPRLFAQNAQELFFLSFFFQQSFSVLSAGNVAVCFPSSTLMRGLTARRQGCAQIGKTSFSILSFWYIPRQRLPGQTVDLSLVHSLDLMALRWNWVAWRFTSARADWAVVVARYRSSRYFSWESTEPARFGATVC